tara:strand:+ start:502 stop:1245 length:744 start_codon:yes stop_codon:yes gene_type:complete
MKVALLLTGQPRFIDDSRPFLFFKNNIIDKYNTDVYCHAWFSKNLLYEKSPWSNNAHYFKTNSNLSKTNPVPNDADKLILEYYNPKKYKFDPPTNFSFNREAQEWMDNNFTNRHPEGFWSNLGYSCVLSHFKSIQNSLELVDKTDYDYFILSRYDITIPTFIEDIFSLDLEKMHLQNIHDRFPDGIYIFGKKYFDWFRNLFNEIQTREIYTRIPHPSTEQFKRTSFSLNYGMDNIQPHPMRINILRK